MTNPQTKTSELDSFINALPIAYSAEFIPQSKSRNAGEKKRSLNWKVTLTRNPACTLTTDYMQGIAHIPQHKSADRKTMHQVEYETLASEKGKWCKHTDDSVTFAKPLPIPSLKDVLYSLVLDSDVMDYAGFESWADNLGYDKDSRAAEKIYRQCIDIALNLRAVIGQPAIDTLRELFQDY